MKSAMAILALTNCVFVAAQTDECDAGGTGGDSCAVSSTYTANNGLCDEYPSNNSPLFGSCPVGSDCTDCGTGRRRSTGWGCGWTDENTSGYISGVMGGSIAAAVIGLILVVVVALPLCCGLIKQFAKIIAIVAIVVSVMIMVLPLLISMGACGGPVDDACIRCNGCTEGDREALDVSCKALGIIAVYFAGFGWLAILLGITAMGMSCCIFCGCCQMKADT